MAGLQVSFHGAARTVTGSCYELSVGRSRILIDCGLFQGPRSLEALNGEPFRFDPKAIDAVVLTHAHLDHCGLIPRLVREGFKGSIFCTPGTAELLEVMWPDAAHLQEQDAARRNRRADRADESPIDPLFTTRDVEAALELVRPVRLHAAFEPAPGFSAKLWNAGHILGSASVEILAGERRLLFSGDLGPRHKSLQRNPEGPSAVDHLFCESTYGDRERPDLTIEERRSVLEAEVNSALAQGGNLIIPVFALERTQELLLDLARLIAAGRIGHAQVFIDSPLASRATQVFRHHSRELEDIEGLDPFDHPSFHFTDSVEASMHLNMLSGAIILAASGMCEGGRVRHHLRYNLPRSDSTILFVGFQAQGTLGRTIVDGARRVRISGRDVAIRARIRRIDSYSAHADRSELIEWMNARVPVAGSVFLTHGESAAIESLKSADALRSLHLVSPEIGERYDLLAGAPARRLSTGRMDVRGILQRDWQNDYADFAVNLKRNLEAIDSSEKRQEALARMKRILNDLAAREEDRRRRRG
jgi:metallo-beta-lactamase family protein